MADTRPSWSPDYDLFRRAERLAKILVQNNLHIKGVALSGSLARKEKKVHDIDLVVLHDGQAYVVGRIKLPWPEKRSEEFLTLGQLLPANVVYEFERERGEIPVDISLVGASALWSCTYLWGLSPFEIFNGFYLRTFNDESCPLYLFEPTNFTVREFAKIPHKDYITLAVQDRFAFMATRVQHRCGNRACTPTLSWKDAQAEAKKRKEKDTYGLS